MNLNQLAVELIKRNPGVENNPRAKDMLGVLQSGDAQSGAALADNLCRTYGVTRDEAIKMARDYFHV